jgi:hypothetical protein
MDKVVTVMIAFIFLYCLTMSMQWWVLSELIDKVDSINHRLDKIIDIFKK